MAEPRQWPREALGATFPSCLVDLTELDAACNLVC